jgi:hypothetical protein
MSASSNRREKQERRHTEAGPPAGWRERRRSVERRLPSVEETEISETDWHAYFVATRQKIEDQVDQVFGKNEEAKPAASPIWATCVNLPVPYAAKC